MIAALVTGFLTTLKHVFRKPITVQYPEERREPPARFRGLHALRRYPETGEERCISCCLCAKICPTQCIRLRDLRRGAQGHRRYDVDLGHASSAACAAEVCPGGGDRARAPPRPPTTGAGDHPAQDDLLRHGGCGAMGQLVSPSSRSSRSRRVACRRPASSRSALALCSSLAVAGLFILQGRSSRRSRSVSPARSSCSTSSSMLANLRGEEAADWPGAAIGAARPRVWRAAARR
jgi:Pyruvate/2-oxoacid:ferredoxin oxidoreductase delta subunit